MNSWRIFFRNDLNHLIKTSRTETAKKASPTIFMHKSTSQTKFNPLVAQVGRNGPDVDAVTYSQQIGGEGWFCRIIEDY